MSFQQELQALFQPPAKLGRKPQGTDSGPEFSVVRSIGPEDLEALAGPSRQSAPQTLSRLNASHHALAQLLAQGHDNIAAARIGGYQSGYVSILLADPQFQELLSYYKGKKEAIFIDQLEKLKLLGDCALDELQGRINEEPGAFSVGQLMSLTELAVVKPLQAKTASQGSAGGSGTAIKLEVQFVSSARPSAAPVIEGDWEKPEDV